MEVTIQLLSRFFKEFSINSTIVPQNKATKQSDYPIKVAQRGINENQLIVLKQEKDKRMKISKNNKKAIIKDKEIRKRAQ